MTAPSYRLVLVVAMGGSHKSLHFGDDLCAAACYGAAPTMTCRVPASPRRGERGTQTAASAAGANRRDDAT